MARKKGKSVSFDAMVKFFMQNYNIPTKKDVDKILVRLERLEKLVKNVSTPTRKRAVRGKSAKGRAATRKRSETASDKVLSTIKRRKTGSTFSEIKSNTGFEDKKLRNIIFRLNKLGKIKRKSRGVYIAA